LGWPGGVGLKLWSVLFSKSPRCWFETLIVVHYSILPGANSQLATTHQAHDTKIKTQTLKTQAKNNHTYSPVLQISELTLLYSSLLLIFMHIISNQSSVNNITFDSCSITHAPQTSKLNL
jgi:hypothetical protein